MKRPPFVLLAFILATFAAALHAAPAKAAGKQLTVTSVSPQAIDLFKRGRDLHANQRVAEAEQLYLQAIEVDPEFALAHAYLGTVQAGAAGEKSMRRAAELSAPLPEAERLFIDAMLNDRLGDSARSVELRRKVAVLLPEDADVQIALGLQLSGREEYADAIRALTRATELRPTAGAALNGLGYAYLAQGQKEDAIKAFRRYAAALRDEPNPHDSLGEALTEAGRFEEAESAYADALRIDPTFNIAWNGIAFARALQGRWDAAVDAISRSESTARRPNQRALALQQRAWIHFARGDAAAAFQALDALDGLSDAHQLRGFFAFQPVVRATMLNIMDRPYRALDEVQKARQRASSTNLSGASAIAFRSAALRQEADALIRLGRVSEARKSAEELRQNASGQSRSSFVQSDAHYTLGLIALAEADARGAIEHLRQCIADDVWCTMKRMHAEAMANDRTASDATRAELLSANKRSSVYVWVREALR